MTTGTLDNPSPIMEDCSSTQPFSNHHHHHRPSFQLTSPQSPDLGYPSSQPGLDPLEQYGNRGGKFSTFFPTSSTLPGGRRASSSGEDGGLPNTSGGSLDGDANFGGQSMIGSHFFDTWCGTIKKEDVWEHPDSCEGAVDNFCYNNANEEAVRHQLKADMNNYAHVSHEARSETFYNREANVSHQTKQAASFHRGATGSFNEGSGGYRCTDSGASDDYLGREEDYGSSCGSGEDQLHAAEVAGPWLSVSPLTQTRWRGAADARSYAPVDLSREASTQKLDSFSEAFPSQQKRRFPIIPSGDSSEQLWEFGIVRGENPGFDSDPYVPPSSSSSPSHPPLLSFPSPPTSSHLMPSVLSPPPTPRPPVTLSPTKMDSPGAFGGGGHSASRGGDSLDVLQFFASHFQSLPSVHSSGMIWKLPLLAHSFPQPPGDPSNIKGSLTSCRDGDLGSIAAPQTFLMSPESTFLTSLHPPSILCPSNAPSLHLPSHHHGAAVNAASYIMTQKVKNGSGSLNQSELQQQSSQIYTGTPFPSILHSCRDQKRSRFTPRPLLNPARRGLGLHSSLSSLRRSEEETCGEEDEGFVFPCVNVGRDFQAELPLCSVGGEGSGLWPAEEESPREQLLWKPLDELDESTILQDEVEKLLAMCSSSCLPGGGSNIELALHCLYRCHGNTLATLDMLLFAQPLPTGDYHYSGSDFWTDSEKVLFNAALGAYGKEFSLIQKMVRTKTTGQCVEFFYLSKKLQDKQRKQKDNRDGEMALQKSMTPAGRTVNRQLRLVEAVPAPTLASCFPCKLCGKMFYKIKSRNAHMKIHRQTQEDWSDRHHRLLAQRLGGNLLPARAPARTFSGPPGTAINRSNAALNSVISNNTFALSNASVLDPGGVVTYGHITMPNSHVITPIDGEDSNRTGAATVLPFNQLWGPFGRGPDFPAFSRSAEQKDEAGTGTAGENQPIRWQ